MSFELNEQITDIEQAPDIIKRVLKELTEGTPKVIKTLALHHQGMVEYQFYIKLEDNATVNRNRVISDFYCTLVRFFLPMLGSSIWKAILTQSGLGEYIKQHQYYAWAAPAGISRSQGSNPNHGGGITHYGNDKTAALGVLMDFIDPLFAGKVDLDTVYCCMYEGIYELSYKTLRYCDPNAAEENTNAANEIMQSLFSSWQLEKDEFKTTMRMLGETRPEIEVLIDRSVANERWHFPKHPGHHNILIKDGEAEVTHWLDQFRDVVREGRIYSQSFFVSSSTHVEANGKRLIHMTYAFGELCCLPLDPAKAERVMGRLYTRILTQLRNVFDARQIERMLDKTHFIPHKYARITNEYLLAKSNPEQEQSDMKEKDDVPPWQEPKYKFVPGRGVVNRFTDEAIPPEEPIFIFRAKDARAAGKLEDYAREFPIGSEHHSAIKAREAQFRQFARDYPERMKEPDTVYNPHPRRHDQAPVDEVDPAELRAELVSDMVKVYMKVQELSTNIMKNNTDLDTVEKVVKAMKNIGLI